MNIPQAERYCTQPCKEREQKYMHTGQNKCLKRQQVNAVIRSQYHLSRRHRNMSLIPCSIGDLHLYTVCGYNELYLEELIFCKSSTIVLICRAFKCRETLTERTMYGEFMLKIHSVFECMILKITF